jgi:Ca-activated chloride channel family protein
VSRAYFLAALVVAGSVSPLTAGPPAPPLHGSAPAALDAAPAATDGSTFRSGVDLVALSVTVLDSDERPVTDLTLDNFRVLEDGVAQPVAFFSAVSVPLDLAILVDGSASMRGKLPLVREAAFGLARTLRQGDRAMIVEFRDGVRVRQPLTADLGKLESALGEIAPAGGTALFNALYVALKDLHVPTPRQGDVRRQAIVVLSDGDDTASLIGYDDVLDLARRRGILVYAISLRLPSPANRAGRASGGRPAPPDEGFLLRRLAQDTGGRAFFPTKLQELKPIYHAIATELGSQYAIGYSPATPATPTATGWRRVQVQVLARPGARSRTRAGYFALASESATHAAHSP